MWDTIRQQWDYYVLTLLLGLYVAAAIVLAAGLFLMVPAALG
jgi:hypothetical protein